MWKEAIFDAHREWAALATSNGTLPGWKGPLLATLEISSRTKRLRTSSFSKVNSGLLSLICVVDDGFLLLKEVSEERKAGCRIKSGER